MEGFEIPAQRRNEDVRINKKIKKGEETGQFPTPFATYLLITDGRSSTISAVYTAIDAIPGSSAVAADRVRPVASDLLLSASLTSKDYLATRLAPLINPANMGGGRGSSHAISVNQGA